MPTPPIRDGSTGSAPRVPVQAEVELRFEDVDSLVRSLSENLSLGGMFLRADEPPPIGTTFRFRFALADNPSIIAGTGKVVWTRETAAGPSQPVGMGVRFVELDGKSRDIIAKIVAIRLERGRGVAGQD